MDRGKTIQPYIIIRQGIHIWRRKERRRKRQRERKNL